MRIYKWPLPMGYSEIEVPLGTDPLSVVAQREVVLYGAVPDEPSGETERLAFYVALTGEEFPDIAVGRFFGSVREPGNFVAHVFQVVAASPEALPEALTATEAES